MEPSVKKGGEMQHTRLRIAAAAAVVSAVAAIPAVAFAGHHVVREHGSFVDGPYAQNFCGVDGSQIDTGRFTFKQDASGAFHATETFKGVFTASGTGKSLELSAAGVDMGNAVENGDGTATITEHTAGFVLKFKIPIGLMLKETD